jgi:arginine decarboxylase
MAERAAAAPLRLCVPGHGGGGYAPYALKRALERHGVWALDWTEVPGLDDLAWPHGPIRDAEARLAEAFGADGAALLVGGSTAGILAAILALAPRARVALGPTHHRSVYAALALAGARPVFLPEVADPETGYSLGLGEAAAAIVERERPALVVVAHPTYQGVAGTPAAVWEAARRTGAAVLADAAHGAHFGADPRLPPPALEAGADVAVLGLHKSLGALTQTAALVWRKGMPEERLRTMLRLIQSSSPSYLLLASADAARAAWAAGGARRWARAVDHALEAAAWLGREAWRPAVPRDPTKLLWRAPTAAAGDLLAALRAAGVEAEYADGRAVLFCLGPHVGRRGIERLRRAVRAARSALPAAAPDRPVPAAAPPAAPDMDMLAALAAPGERVPLAAAVGRVAGDFLVPYPPGIPRVLPGRRLSAEDVAAVAADLGRGREVQGVAPDATIKVLRPERGAGP